MKIDGVCGEGSANPDSFDESLSENKRAVAVHELGHAFLAHHLGGKVIRVTIEKGESGQWRGQTEASGIGIMARGPFIMAGQVAEGIEGCNPIAGLYRMQQDREDFGSHVKNHLDTDPSEACVYAEMALALAEKVLQSESIKPHWQGLLKRLLEDQKLSADEFDSLPRCVSSDGNGIIDGETDEDAPVNELMNRIMEDMEPS